MATVPVVSSSSSSRHSSPDVEAAYARNIAEEIQHFREEMAAHKHFVADLDSVVGTEEERQRLTSLSVSSSQFLADVKNSMKDINLDVHSVKMQLMEQLAVAERAKVKVGEVGGVGAGLLDCCGLCHGCDDIVLVIQSCLNDNQEG